jgi:hypothetical protein
MTVVEHHVQGLGLAVRREFREESGLSYETGV